MPLDTCRACDLVRDRPSVVFAYTIKGGGLPIAGDPLNHAAMLTPAQINDLRDRIGLTQETEWDHFPEGSDAAKLCAAVGSEINNVPRPPRPRLQIPRSSGAVVPESSSTQQAFGRILVRLGKDKKLAERMVTASPDVSLSTPLGGWINQQEVFTLAEYKDYFGEDRLVR